MSRSTDPTRTRRSPARCALGAAGAALISAFDGTQPMLRQSPPIKWLSTSATRAVPEGQRPGRGAAQTGGRAKCKDPHRPSIFCKNPHCPRGFNGHRDAAAEYPLGFDRPRFSGGAFEAMGCDLPPSSPDHSAASPALAVYSAGVRFPSALWGRTSL